METSYKNISLVQRPQQGQQAVFREYCDGE